jgi:hypothetical protein
VRLFACPECARHVRVDAGVCPFCDHVLPPSNARARVGALLIGAAALSTLGACRAMATKYGGPPAPPQEPDTSVAAPAEPEAPEEPSEPEAPEEPSEPEAPDAPEVG